MKASRPFSYLAVLSAALVIAAGPLYADGTITHQITLPSGMTWCEAPMIDGLLTQVNTFRSQNSLPALAMSALGMKDAELRAVQFASYMTTNPPGSPGFNPHQGWDTTAAGVGYNVISENLAFMTIDPAYIVYSVWQTPLHRAAMLAPDANVAGVSCIFYNGTAYWTYEPGACSGPSCAAIPPANPPNPPPAGTPTLDAEEWSFLDLINAYRAQNGLNALRVSVMLETAAKWMSNDMAVNNYASHTDALGRSPGARLAAFGYSYTPWGENIAGGFPDAQNAFNQWLNACDPDPAGNCTYAHRKTMLGAGFSVIGVSRTYNGASTYGWYWVTDFGGYADQIILRPSTNPATPTVVSFKATPSTVSAGQPATLSWNVTGATTITIDNGVGDVSLLISKAVSPVRTTQYVLTAINSAGSVTAGVTVAVNAAGSGDNQAPTAPTLTSLVATGATRVDLAWTASSDSVGVAGYQILRNGSALASVPASALTFADTGVQPATLYTYSVKSYDAAGNYSSASNARQVTTAALPPPSGSALCPGPSADAFTGCYYNNSGLAGRPALVRTDSQINFDWAAGAPSSGLTPRDFSVRWQGYFSFGQGTYTFTALASDGIRFYVDGALVLDRWTDQPPAQYRVDRALTQGSHLLTVEYYERSGNATAHLSWQNAAPPTQPPAILSFTTSPAAIVPGQASTLSWVVSGANRISIDNAVGDVTNVASRTVAPAATTTYTLTASNPAGSVTARATVTVTAAQDTQAPTAPVLISAAANSGSRVELAWSVSADNVGVTGYQVLRDGTILASLTATTHTDTTASPGASYTYAVRAHDAAGNYSGTSNSLRVSVPAPPPTGTCPAAAVNAFTGCYYNNTTLGGSPALVRTDSQINFNWGTGSPATSIRPDAFSARWQGYFVFESGPYTLNAITSDGMRVYIDGEIVLDRWRDQPVYMYAIRRSISAGQHLVTVEFYAKSGMPTAHLTWQKN